MFFFIHQWQYVVVDPQTLLILLLSTSNTCTTALRKHGTISSIKLTHLWRLRWQMKKQSDCVRFRKIITYKVPDRYVVRTSVNGLNTLRPRQNGRHFPDDIFKRIFLNEKVWTPIKFHWNLFLRVQLTISQHWFRLWLGVEIRNSNYI